MKAPRFRLAWFMVGVAIAALDFWAIRTLMEFRLGALLMLGALPMANFLAVGLLIAFWRPESRLFLLGFEAYGVMASVIYLAIAIVFTQELWWSYVNMICVPFARTNGWPVWTISRKLIVYFVGSGLATLPQLTFAVFGGLKYRNVSID